LGNYCGLISTINADDDLSDGQHGLRSFRWAGWQPHRLGYVLSLAFLTGSVLFLGHAVIRLLHGSVPDTSAVAAGLTVAGSLIFICGFAVEVREVRRRHAWWDPDNLSWWRAVLSLLGCLGFALGGAAVLLHSHVRVRGLTVAEDAVYLVGIGLFLVSSYLILRELEEG